MLPTLKRGTLVPQVCHWGPEVGLKFKLRARNMCTHKLPWRRCGPACHWLSLSGLRLHPIRYSAEALEPCEFSSFR